MISLRILVVALLSATTLLLGCGLSRKEVFEIQYSDGCYFSAKSMSSTQADRIRKEWDIHPPCTIDSDSDVKEDKILPKKVN